MLYDMNCWKVAIYCLYLQENNNNMKKNRMLVAVLAIAAAQVMAGKNPKDYNYKTNYEPSEPLKEGFRFTITAQAEFSANIADLDIGSGLGLHYYWFRFALLLESGFENREYRNQS